MNFHPPRIIRQLCCTNYLVFLLVCGVYWRNKQMLQWIKCYWMISTFKDSGRDWKYFLNALLIIVRKTYSAPLLSYREWKVYKDQDKQFNHREV